MNSLKLCIIFIDIESEGCLIVVYLYGANLGDFIFHHIKSGYFDVKYLVLVSFLSMLQMLY